MWKEGINMCKKGTSVFFSALGILFYIFIVMYLFFHILNINETDNFQSALLFEIIDFVLFGYLILRNFFSNPIKAGYFVPLTIVAVVYSLIVNVVNLFLALIISNTILILLNLIVLFLYFLISVPMYLMGINNK